MSWLLIYEFRVHKRLIFEIFVDFIEAFIHDSTIKSFILLFLYLKYTLMLLI